MSTRLGLVALLVASAAYADTPKLTADEINKAMVANQPAFRRCFNDALKKQPNLNGRFTYRFTIGGDGKVSKASRVSPTKTSGSVDACITEAIKRIVFRASGSTSTVNYPLNATAP